MTEEIKRLNRRLEELYKEKERLEQWDREFKLRIEESREHARQAYIESLIAIHNSYPLIIL